MKTHIYLILLLSSIFLMQSCVDESIDNSDKNFPINLTGETEGRNVNLSWTLTNISSFEEYVIVRSTEPIENDASIGELSFFVVDRLDEYDTPSYTDEVLPFAESIYYKIFVNVGDRFLESNAIQVDLNIISLPISSNIMEISKEEDIIYFKDNSQNRIYRFNYKTSLVENQAAASFWFDDINVRKDGNGSYELVLPSSFSSEVYIYDAQTLAQEKLISTNDDVYRALGDEDGNIFVTTEYYNASMEVYNRNTGNRTGNYNFSYNYDYRLIGMLDQQEKHIIETSTNAIHIHRFDASNNHLGQKSLSLPGVSMLSDIIVSPDQNYFIAHFDGRVLDKDLQEVAYLGNTSTFYIDFAFSEDGTKLFAMKSFPSEIEQYSFPDLTLEKTYEFSSSLRRVFFDEGELIVIGETFFDFTNVIVIEKIVID